MKQRCYSLKSYYFGSRVYFKGEVIKPADACRYLGVQVDSNLTFENHLKTILSKMASTISCLYLVRNQFLLKVRVDFFKSVVLIFVSVEYSFKLFQQKT